MRTSDSSHLSDDEKHSKSRRRRTYRSPVSAVQADALTGKTTHKHNEPSDQGDAFVTAISSESERSESPDSETQGDLPDKLRDTEESPSVNLAGTTKTVPYFLVTLLVLLLAGAAMFLNMTNGIGLTENYVCSLPLASMVLSCKHYQEAREPDFPRLVEMQSELVSVMEGSGYGIFMAFDMTDLEFAVSDLSVLVRTSDLAAKDEIAGRLDEFASAAMSTSVLLSQFDSELSEAVQFMIAMDSQIGQNLERIQRSEENQWSISRIFSTPETATHQKKVIDMFDDAVEMLTGKLRELITTSDITTDNLNELKNKLSTIGMLVNFQDKAINNQHDEEFSGLLDSLWATLGSKRQKRALFANHQKLLSSVTQYRSQALDHVKYARKHLQTLSADLRVLRKKAAARLLGGDAAVSLEIQIDALRAGVSRLEERRLDHQRSRDEAIRRIRSGRTI